MEALRQSSVWAPALLLVVARVAGIFLAAPVLSEVAVPKKLRLFSSIVISLAIVGRVGRLGAPPTHCFDLVMAVTCEILLGVAIGFAARIFLVGVELGAFHVGQQMGLALAEVFNPMVEGAGGVLRRMFGILAVVLFLAIGGHRMLLSAVLGTFEKVPLMGFAPELRILDVVAGLLAASFVLALKVAAPVLIAMLLATVATGMVNRTIPQSNILSTGLPVRAMLGLLALAGGLSMLPALIETAWAVTASRLTRLVGVGS